MASNDDDGSSTTRNVQLVPAWEAKRRPRPPGSSWLLDPDLDLATLLVRDLRRRLRLRNLASRPPDHPIVPRKAFDSHQRKEVCMMAAANPNLSHEELARLFKTNKSTISRTLKDSGMWMRFNPVTQAKVTRRKDPVYDIMETRIVEWARLCSRDGIFITDKKLREKAMELAKEYRLFDLQRPFACSPKWIRNVKTRLGLVDGKLAPYKEPSFDEVDGTGSGGSRTSEARSSSPEPSEAIRGVLPVPSSSELTPRMDEFFKSPQSSIQVDSATSGLHTDPPAPLSANPLALNSTAVDSLSVWAPEALPLPTVDLASPQHGLSQASLAQISPELCTPGKLAMPYLVANAGRYEGTHAGPAHDIGLGSAQILDQTSFIFTNGSADVPQALPDMAPSFPPLVPDGLTAPIPFGSLDYGIGTPLMPDVFTDPTAPSIPLSDPPVPSSSAWPIGSNASPAFVNPADISVPFIPQIDPLSTFDPQLCMSLEDIDALAVEMRNWPVEDLLPLGDIGASSSQGQAGFPYDTMSSGALLPPQWPSVSSNALGGPDFLFPSTQP